MVSLSVLGRGAYGVVEKVWHEQSGTTMAVKVRAIREHWVLRKVGEDLSPSFVSPAELVLGLFRPRTLENHCTAAFPLVVELLLTPAGR